MRRYVYYYVLACTYWRVFMNMYVFYVFAALRGHIQGKIVYNVMYYVDFDE